MAHQRLQPLLPATGGGDVSQAEVLLKRKFSDRLRSEIGRLDVKDIVTDSRGRLTLEVRDALNSGSAGTEDEVSTRRLTTRLLKRQSVWKPKPTVKCR